MYGTAGAHRARAAVLFARPPAVRRSASAASRVSHCAARRGCPLPTRRALARPSEQRATTSLHARTHTPRSNPAPAHHQSASFIAFHQHQHYTTTFSSAPPPTSPIRSSPPPTLLTMSAPSRTNSERRGELLDNLKLYPTSSTISSRDTFAEPAPPPLARQATHPALEAARAAAYHSGQAQGQRAAPASAPGAVAMPPAASGRGMSQSPSAYAQQFQSGAGPAASDAGFINNTSSPHGQRPARKPSILRRSINALSSRHHAQPSQTSFQSQGGGLQRKPSALRKSMAWLLGPPPAPAPVRLAPGMGDSPSIAAEKQFRAQGQDAYLGGGGDGSEWDVDGSGAAFWKRFSIAQRHAQDKSDPLTRQSEKYVHSQQRATKTMRVLIALALIVVVGLAVGLGVGIPLSHNHHGDAPAAQTQDQSGAATKRAFDGARPVGSRADPQQAAAPWDRDQYHDQDHSSAAWEPVTQANDTGKKSLKLAFGRPLADAVHRAREHKIRRRALTLMEQTA